MARLLDHVAGLREQRRDVDGGEGVGALHDEDVAWGSRTQLLAGAQNGQWAFQPAEIDVLLGHGEGRIMRPAYLSYRP
jgi:hypothetical protein